jgi:hypothetical protein
MREAIWRGFYALRQDGPTSEYLAISLGKAAEHMANAEPEQEAMVRIIDEETIEIKLIPSASDTQQTEGDGD